jgi:hypothetical protein
VNCRVAGCMTRMMSSKTVTESLMVTKLGLDCVSIFTPRYNVSEPEVVTVNEAAGPQSSLQVIIIYI